MEDFETREVEDGGVHIYFDIFIPRGTYGWVCRIGKDVEHLLERGGNAEKVRNC